VAKHYQSKLFVVHVISPLVYRSVPPELLAEAQKRTRLEATAQMARLQRRQGGTPGLESEAVLREGDVAGSLLRLVSEYNIDLLVVATRGYRHLKRLLLGSVAEKLFRQAFCPVLVVPGPAVFGSGARHTSHCVSHGFLSRIICSFGICHSPGQRL
jgi:nucleotide-binding universal stress UspA family protein